MSREKHLEAMLNDAEQEIEVLREVIELFGLDETRALQAELRKVSTSSLYKLRSIDSQLFDFIANKFDEVRGK